MKGEDPDHAQRDLVEAIDRGEFSRWAVKVQILTEEEAKHIVGINSILPKHGRKKIFL